MLYTVSYLKCFFKGNKAGVNISATIKNVSHSTMMRMKKQYEEGKKFSEYGTKDVYVMGSFYAEKQLQK